MARYSKLIVDLMEVVAGVFVGLMMLNTFLAVILRKFFGVAIPDNYDLGQMMLCMLVFWGIGVASSRGSHLTMDMLWSALKPGMRRVVDLFAAAVTFAALLILTLSILDQVVQTRADRVLTYDLRLPTWPFLAVAWIGTFSALFLLALRTIRMMLRPVGGSGSHSSDEIGS